MPPRSMQVCPLCPVARRHGTFPFGRLRRRDPVETMLLESGDVFVFGGPSRLRYHGVARILSGTAPVARPRRPIQPHVPAVPLP